METSHHTVRFGFRPAVWATAHRNPFDVQIELTEQGEALGMDAVFFGDRMLAHVADGSRSVYGSSHTEVTVTLAAMAARTTRISVAPLVLVLPFRHPVQLAKIAASLDLLAQGRLLLPVGAGWNSHEFATLGLSRKEASRRMEESMEIMRRLWLGESVDYEGEFYTLKDVAISPLPYQEGGPPLWLGTFSPRSGGIWDGRSFDRHTENALQRVGRLANVWVPLLYNAGLRQQISPEVLGEAWNHVQAAASDYQRKVGVGFAFSHWFHCIETREDEEEAERGLQAFFSGSLAEAKATYLIGSATEIVDRVHELLQLVGSPSWFILTMLNSSQRQLELLANEIVPHLRQMTESV